MLDHRRSSSRAVLSLFASVSPMLAREMRETEKREARIRKLADVMGAPRVRLSDPPKRGVIPPQLLRRAR